MIEKNGMVIVDDCYNANPVSMKASLDVLKDADGRVYVVPRRLLGIVVVFSRRIVRVRVLSLLTEEERRIEEVRLLCVDELPLNEEEEPDVEGLPERLL